MRSLSRNRNMTPRQFRMSARRASCR
jgi:hypothetical protein